MKSLDLADMLRRLSPSEIVRRAVDTRGLSSSGRGDPAAALLAAARSVQQLRKSPAFVQRWSDSGFGSSIPADSDVIQEHARNVLESGWASSLMFAETRQLAGLVAASEGQQRVSKGRGPKTGPNIYGVRRGRFSGVFVGLAWGEVEPFVSGFNAAMFRKWPTEQAARSWVASGNDGQCRLVTPATLRAARVVAGLDAADGADVLCCWDEPAPARGVPAAGPAAAEEAAAAAAASAPSGFGAAGSAKSSAESAESLDSCMDFSASDVSRALRAAGSSVASPAAASSFAAASAASAVSAGGPTSGFAAFAGVSDALEVDDMEPPGAYTMWFDGASRSNPGPAAWGSVLRAGNGDHAGRLCFSGHGYMGEATNNEAEYTGLIRGMEMSGKLLVSGSSLLVRGDSKLALSQVMGRWQAREPRMAVLRDAAVKAMRALEQKGVTVRLEHVLRDRNAEADALASSGVDEGIRGALLVGYETGMGLPRA